MSAKELKQFESQLELLSYAEQLAIIEFLAKLLQKRQKENINETSKFEVEKINAVLEKIPESKQLEFCDAGLESVREALEKDTW